MVHAGVELFKDILQDVADLLDASDGVNEELFDSCRNLVDTAFEALGAIRTADEMEETNWVLKDVLFKVRVV